MGDEGEEYDAVRFFDELTGLLDQSAAGEPGLNGLRGIADLGLWTLGATGVAFIEFGPAVGRVIAASGSARAVLGRRIESGDPKIGRLFRAGRVAEVGADELPDELSEPGTTGGAYGFLVGRVSVGTKPAGAIVAYLAKVDEPATDRQRATLTYLTAMASRLYRDNTGLPLHADPGVRVRPDTAVLLDADGTVCWLNPGRATLLDSASIVLGEPLPLPVPGPGQVIEHLLPDGRWLQLMSMRLPGDVGQSVAIRDVTEARRWDQSRELFVALTSHELRTPVTVIKGYADTLTDRWDALDDQGRRHAARVLGQRAGDLAKLLDRLLSAVGEPGIPPVVSRFSLRDAVGEVIDALPEDLRGRVRVSLPADLPSVFGERASITSVVTELLANAAKYAPSTTGDIELDGLWDDRTVGFLVSDRGIGVRPEHVESAFERFWQADTGDHRRYSGVGLGLYLVRRIVERQNGWVSLRPRDSGGTVAEVRLPRGDLKSGGIQVGGGSTLAGGASGGVAAQPGTVPQSGTMTQPGSVAQSGNG